MRRHPIQVEQFISGRMRCTGLSILIIVLVSVQAALATGSKKEMPSNGKDRKTMVRYSDFGAKGDGKADDIDAIAAAHDHANKHGLPVKADDGATYYVSGKEKTAIIQTDTDFGTAKFIIDDTKVETRGQAIFEVRSALPQINPPGISSLKMNQKKIAVTLPRSCIVTVHNAEIKRYIRYGKNQNKGKSQVDVFILDKNGNVDKNTPIIWDFEKVTGISAIPMDDTTLTITGGHFTTIANAAESKYTYYSRGITIRRSNVVMDGLEHRITGEGKQGAPYGGFINVSRCANVTVRNCIFTAHKTYQTIGSAGSRVSMGSYDISLNAALNVSFINCRQTNDIKDRKYWGIMGTNFCKNLLLETCEFSRFDAHMGVTNATIKKCTLGYMGIKAIGHGTFTVEDTTVHCGNFISLRPDYGSTWKGDFIIRNCVFVPTGSNRSRPHIIGGSNSGQHDFGYTCTMPSRILIENLRIEDKNRPANYKGPVVFGNFNRSYKDASYKEKFPYIKTKEVILKNVTTASGKPVGRSDNPVMFRETKITVMNK